VLAEEMLVEASLLEPVDGLAGIREADDVGEPALPRPDRQQARQNFRLALPIGNAVFTPGCV
jgi:hypothetical protein